MLSRVQVQRFNRGARRTIIGWLVSNTRMLVPALIVFLAVGLIAMVAVASVKNARAIKRDVEKRFAKLDARLEADANTLVDHLLDRER